METAQLQLVLLKSENSLLQYLFRLFKNYPLFHEDIPGTSRESFEKAKAECQKILNKKKSLTAILEKLFIQYPKGIDSSLFYLSRKVADEKMILFETDMYFYNFFYYLRCLIENYEPMFLDFKGSERQVSPPLEAYLSDRERRFLRIKEMNPGYYLYGK